MKFIFPILAIVICLVASYFSLAESEKFGRVQTAKIEAKKTNRAVTTTADAVEVKSKAEQVLLEKSKEELAVANQKLIAIQSSGGTLRSEGARLDSQIAAQELEFEELETVIAEIKKVAADIGEDISVDNLDEKITEMEEELQEKQARTSELESLIEGGNTTLASRQADVQRLVDRKVAREKKIARNALVARITAVNQDWGFLVIGAGKNSGFTPQTQLIVQRNGRRIGKVTPSTIEATQTIAEIDLESLTPGVRIQPGDRVILAKPSSN